MSIGPRSTDTKTAWCGSALRKVRREQTNLEPVFYVYLPVSSGRIMASVRRAAVQTVIAIAGVTALAFAQAPAPPKPFAAAAPPSAESVKKAEQILADARKALAGDKFDAVKTIVASGRTKRVRGNNLVPIEFEIFFELPAKYVRVDEFP